MSEIINCKITDEAAKQVTHLCHRLGVNHNTLLRNIIDTMLRYMSDKYNLTPDMDKLMMMFEGAEGWKEAFNLCDPDKNPEVAFAIYFLQDQSEKKGLRASLVEKPYFGIWTQTENVMDIFERAFCTLLPEPYKRLRRLGTELGTENVVETILTLISMYGSDADSRIYREMFEDANRSEYGKRPHEGAPYRRKHHRTPDTFEGQQSLRFDNPEDAMGFKPHGGEW